jgi:hypothetical protein
MSGLDPTAAVAAQVVAGAMDAVAEAALSLGVSADVLQATIRVGDALEAQVLPPQGRRDLVQIAGQTVVAELPAGVYPGETLVLQVTGFSGNQILVRNLGVANPNDPQPTVDVRLPLPQSATQTATLTTIAPKSDAMPEPAARIAPPPELFVAASVRPAQIAGDVPQTRIDPSSLEARLATARVEPPVTLPAGGQAPRPLVATAAIRNAGIPIGVAVTAAARQHPLANASANLLNAVRVPQNAVTLAAARIAKDAVARLPQVFERLETALETVVSDSRAATLRTLVAFTARLDPQNAEAFAHQISSFVSNVLEGAEAKAAQLVRALSAPQAPLAQEKAAERSIAIEHDVKSLVLSMISRPPANTSPQLERALHDALVTLTGAQLQTLSANADGEQGIVMTLPLFFRENGQPSQVRISREQTRHGERLDAENFHIAFVLDTQSLGTVAIDMQTVGRTVAVNVKTQRRSAVAPFQASLADLRGRLERLRYRIGSMTASPVTPTAPAANAGASAEPRTLDGSFDRRV